MDYTINSVLVNETERYDEGCKVLPLEVLKIHVSLGFFKPLAGRQGKGKN